MFPTSPYFPPTYFPPAYFAMPAASGSTGYYFPSTYFPSSYFPQSYFNDNPGEGGGGTPVSPGNGGYYLTRYYPRGYYPDRYYPRAVVGVGAGYYPTRYYPALYYPSRYYPGSGPASRTRPIGALYGPLATSLVSFIQSFNIFTPNNVSISLLQEPFPLAGGPACYVVPGGLRPYAPDGVGAGRYFRTTDATFRLRVVDQSVRDPLNQDISRLTDAIAGLIRTAHALAASVHVQFVPTAGVATMMPLAVASIEPPKSYRKAQNYAYIDIVCNAKYQSQLSPARIDTTSAGPTETTLADVLLAVHSLLIAQSSFTPQTAIIGIDSDPPPLVSTPFAIISPGRFAWEEASTLGAGRALAPMRGSINISIINPNSSDIVGRADSSLLDPSVGLLSAASEVVDALDMRFPALPSGSPAVDRPIWLSGASEPAYWPGGRSSPPYTSITLSFDTVFPMLF